jgi:hypothetical protein
MLRILFEALLNEKITELLVTLQYFQLEEIK